MKHIILDLDTGIDDSMALALAVLDRSINLLGVIATFGNVTTQTSAYNTRFILQRMGAKQIPVFVGLSHTLNNKNFTRQAVSAKIHGRNGMGNINFPIDCFTPINDSWEMFLQSKIDNYGENLIYITTGSLTNLASFIQRFPIISSKIGKIITMGGSLIFPGNINVGAEANINQDPEAARIVMESGLPFTLVPLDVTMKSRITLDMAKEWRRSKYDGLISISKMVEYYISQHPGQKECYVHDPSAVVYAIHPEYFQTIQRFVTVLLDGPCRARIVGDLNRIRSKHVNTTLCLDVDAEKLVSYINMVFMS